MAATHWRSYGLYFNQHYLLNFPVFGGKFFLRETNQVVVIYDHFSPILPPGAAVSFATPLANTPLSFANGA